MNWLKRKWREWHDARKDELNRRGYNYAAGQLLRSKGDQQTIERLEAESSRTFDFNDFDQGIKDALFDWGRLHPTITASTLEGLRDWVYASWGKKAPGVNTSDKSALAAFAAQVGYDLDAVEAELNADRQERNQSEQQLDAAWLAAADKVIKQTLVDHATAPLADRAPRDPDYYGHPECNRVTNSPCPWSNSGPLADTCKVCGKNFPSWN